eukprot:6491304-Amphidinium_carterae.1
MGASGSGVGGVSWFQPSEPAGFAVQGYLYRGKLPEYEVTNTDPVSTLHSFETWLLRCSTAISTWCKNPVEAITAWEQLLNESTRRWMLWSVSSPTERKMESLNRPMSSLGRPSINVASNAFEAVLRSDLLERVPRVVLDKIYSEGRLSSVDVLEELMKAVLPAYHTVRVTLLDSIEGLSNKCTSYSQLQGSLRQWTRGIRIAMARYGLNPEPRRLWLSMMSRVSGLQAEPLFAAILDRHMVQTGARVNQTLETVLIRFHTQVSSGKNTPKAHSAGLGSGSNPYKPSASASKPGETSQGSNLCRAWALEALGNK